MTKEKTISRLSRESEERIIDATEKIANEVNDGSSPNDAIIKIAEEMRIPVGHIDLLVRAYNTGRTNVQRKSASDVLGKAEEFPIADALQIKKELYPDTYKTAAEIYKSTAVSDEYNQSPLWADRIPTKEAIFTKKACLQKVALIDKPVDAYPSEKNLYKEAIDKIEYRHRKLAEFRSAGVPFKTNVVDRTTKLANYFKGYNARPFNEILTNSITLFGKVAEQVLNTVKQYLPKEKLAAVKPSKDDWKYAIPDKEPYASVQNLIKAAQDYSVYSQKLALAETATKNVEGELLRPFAQPKHQTSVIADNQSSINKSASIFGNLFNTGLSAITKTTPAQGIMEKIPGTSPTEKLLQKDLSNLMDPYHEADLREIQTEAMLNDLMANDEVINTHHPEDVIKIFNEINQMAPRAANQKMLIRALIRKRLEYGGDKVDPFDIAQLLDIEEKLKARDAIGQKPQPGMGGAMMRGPVGDI